MAKYYSVSLLAAFDKKIDVKPLSAAYVSKITYTLSALFTGCVKNGILLQNPVANATKSRVGEMDIPAYLDNTQIPIFLDALNEIDIDNSVRVALVLMLMLGLRSGDGQVKHTLKKHSSNFVNILLTTFGQEKSTVSIIRIPCFTF